MHKYIVVAALVSCAGIAASLLVLPSPSDYSRLRAADLQKVEAGKIDLAAEYAQGRRNFAVIYGLAEKKAAAGDHAGAALLWEEYTTSNKNDLKAQKELAEQYKLAGRKTDYMKQMELIRAAEKSPERSSSLQFPNNASVNLGASHA